MAQDRMSVQLTEPLFRHLWLRSMGVASTGAAPCRTSKMANCPLYCPAPSTCTQASTGLQLSWIYRQRPLLLVAPPDKPLAGWSCCHTGCMHPCCDKARR